MVAPRNVGAKTLSKIACSAHMDRPTLLKKYVHPRSALLSRDPLLCKKARCCQFLKKGGD